MLRLSLASSTELVAVLLSLMNEASDASRITQGLNLVGFFPGEFG